MRASAAEARVLAEEMRVFAEEMRVFDERMLVSAEEVFGSAEEMLMFRPATFRGNDACNACRRDMRSGNVPRTSGNVKRPLHNTHREPRFGNWTARMRQCALR